MDKKWKNSGIITMYLKNLENLEEFSTFFKIN